MLHSLNTANCRYGMATTAASDHITAAAKLSAVTHVVLGIIVPLTASATGMNNNSADTLDGLRRTPAAEVSGLCGAPKSQTMRICGLPHV
jgi:hypothetical protein